MKDELTALAERVQALTGPCDEVDAMIFMALRRPDWRESKPWKKTNGWFKPNNARDAFAYFFHDGMGGRTTSIPRYTASLDAAMTLATDERITRFGGPLGMVRWAMEMLERAGAPADALPRYVTAAALLALAEQVQQ